MIQECVKTGEGLKIIEIIASLRKEFIESTSMNARKGGLISMAAVALGLGDVCIFSVSLSLGTGCRKLCNSDCATSVGLF